jgi:ABC-2 type transport system permease protein
MTIDTRRRPPLVPAAQLTPIPLRNRLYGLDSIFEKSVRDSRRAFIIEVLFLAVFLFVLFAIVSNEYTTQAARDQTARLASGLGPTGSGGITGPIVNVATIGGDITWTYGVIFPIVAALWSILALTGTLSGEARRGSLDFVAAAPRSMRRIVLEKVGAHVALMAITVAAIALAAWAGGAAFQKFPGDEIAPQSAVGFALWIGLIALCFGGLAFALAQFLGRAAGVGIASFVLVAGPFLVNFRSVEPAFGPLSQLTPWGWTWGQAAALAGQYDWPSLVPVAIAAIVLMGIGIEAFARRDILTSGTVPISIPRLRLPSLAIGLDGPIGRSFGERLPVTLAWALGVGIFGWVVAAVSHTAAQTLATSPDLLETFRRVFPTTDFTTAGGWLQLFVRLLFIFAGLAAATLVAGWASDETSGRLEMLLATRLTRARWALMSGLGVLAAITLMTAIVALAVGASVATTGSEALTPMTGTFVLGFFAAAMAGIGFAVGGLVRGSAAVWAVVVVVATYLIDILIPALNLPSELRQVALTAHLGQTMVGVWDWAGIAACLVLALGGLAIGAWGFARREVGR